MVFDLSSLLTGFLTVAVTIFVAELTDKDALLLLALATKIKSWTAFAAGSTAFTITTTIIVTAGYLLLKVFPVEWIKLAGGVIMIIYAVWEFFFEKEEEVESEEQKILSKGRNKSGWSIFLGAVTMLAILDLAGDATEVLTIVYVAHFQNILLVFLGCVSALVAASAVETLIGNRLGKMISVSKLKLLSFLIFLIIGSTIILMTLFPSLIPFAPLA